MLKLLKKVGLLWNGLIKPIRHKQQPPAFNPSFNDTQDDFYQINYEWYKAKLKAFNSKPEYAKELELLATELWQQPNVNTVLDYGCGTGHAMTFLNKYFDVYGYDRFDYYEGDRAKFNQSGIIYDAVYMMHSINHIPNLDEAIDSIYNQLREGGFVIVITPDPYFFAENYKPDPTVIKYLADTDLNKLFLRHGFLRYNFLPITHPNNIHRIIFTFQKP